MVGIFAIIVFPWWVYFIAHLLNQGFAGPWQAEPSQSQEKNMSIATNFIVSSEKDWHSSLWKSTLQTKLDSLNLQAVITDSSGIVVFGNMNTHARHFTRPSHELEVVDNGRVLGTVSLFVKTPFDKIATISAVIAIGVAIFIVSFQIQRFVIKPLEGMSKAARKLLMGI